ncbi:MAG: S24 family peptidase [Sphingobium sp.]|uniref:S24 family peptidase n=1 Tax=Sphingobium sp. TaxID=1912891 RepID=UPI0029B12EEE|nr:S24 family peptidase [Sphingobium sp.]MDX3909702.1 S24 family peptidase [Sphingobium sp.]
MEMQDIEQEKARQLIGRIVSSTGLSVTEIARKAGLSPSTLTRIYPEPTVNYTLSTRTLAKIRAAFPMNDNDDVSSRVSETRQAFIAQPPPSIPVYALGALEDASVSAQLSVPADFELYSANLQDAKLQQVPQFAQLDKDRFVAAYMPGDAMEPRFRAGEMVLIDKIRPAAIGGDVFVGLNGGDGSSVVTVAKLVERDRNQITLLQHRYKTEINIHRSRVDTIFPIVALFEDRF